MKVALNPRMISDRPPGPILGVHLSEHLREPVVERGEESIHRSAHHDEVKCATQIGVVPMDVQRGGGECHPSSREDEK